MNYTLNTTRQEGIRIYSNGTEIGGNFWNGYSDACMDDDYDGFCDVPYDSGYGMDELPYSSLYGIPPTTTTTTVPTTTTIPTGYAVMITRGMMNLVVLGVGLSGLLIVITTMTTETDVDKMLRILVVVFILVAMLGAMQVLVI
jgi:hypothetical protein